MRRTMICGTGRYVPPRVVTNEDLAQWMDTSDEWIRQRTGIKERHWIDDDGGVGASDLGLAATKKALDKAGWQPEDINLIIFATMTPDIFLPGSGCFLQQKLGLKETPALDIRQQCTGFLYGIELADAYIRSNVYKRILFVGAEVQSTGLERATSGRDISVIFADGAAAVCLEGREGSADEGFLTSKVHADGRLIDKLMLEAPASRENPRISIKMLEEGRHLPIMDGRTIFKKAVVLLPKVTYKVLQKAGVQKEDVDLYIPHQANMRINQAFQQAMDLPEEKVFHNIQRYGNTTAATIPLALDEALEMGRVGPGSLICFLGLGAGVTWGASLYRFPALSNKG